MGDYLFGLMLLALVAGLAFDVLFGRGFRYRKWLHSGLIALSVLVLGTMPSCTSGDGDRPEGPAIPYSF